MRTATQAVIVLAIACVGAGGWYLWRDQASVNASVPAARTGPAPMVEVVTIRGTTVTERSESVGTARANESVTITAKQAGNVAIISFEEGQRVNANQALIELENRERRADLEGSRADLDQARATRDEVKQRLDRAKQLRSTGNVSEAQYDQLEALHRAAEGRIRSAEARIRAVDARLDDVRILAPFAGRVGLRQVSIGALVQPGSVITTLDDISKIKVDFAVPEIYLGRLKMEQEVAARSSAYADRTFKGRVTAIDTRVDPATRAVKVNALFDNSDEALKPGMFLSVEVVLDTRENAVMVPEDALLAEGAKQFVFIIKDNRVERREVRLGQRFSGEVEVADGLKAGDTVVARGIQKIRHNQLVNPQPLRPTS
jgi:membrane fusion protein, multidrug efflux system